MLSRRNVRIKVMQALYAAGRSGAGYYDTRKRYLESVDKSYELYIYSLLVINKISEYANKDAAMRTEKLLPTDADKAFQPKLFHNAVSMAIYKNDTFNRLIRKYEMLERVEEDSIRQIYTDFLKEESYAKYLASPENTDDEHQFIYLELYRFCLNNDFFHDILEDYHLSWADDESLVAGAIKKTIKALPESRRFCEEYMPTDETIKELGEALLAKIFDNEPELLGIIEPNLRGWDADRLAVIDMISLKMALAELLYFPSIPTKVTINEFVDISKMYGTDKSKDFVNGILDRMMKQLLTDGRIKKEGRGLVG
jgi:transcription antitermination protein NusB